MSGGFLHRSGAWLGIQQVHVKQAGTWKQVQQAYVKQAGVWKLWFAALTAVIANSGTAWGEAQVAGIHSGGTAGGTLTFNSDGSISRTGTPIDNSSGSSAWLASIGAGNGSPYFMRATVVSGVLTSGSVTGVWLACNINRSFVNQHTSTPASYSCQLSVDFATDAAGTTIVSAGNIWNVKATIAPI